MIAVDVMVTGTHTWNAAGRIQNKTIAFAPIQSYSLLKLQTSKLGKAQDSTA